MDINELRVIKKYPNRRLYDTAISSYITLDDIKKLVMEHTQFCIQDARTCKDITRSILLQIILEQEEEGEPIFSSEVLAQLIRFYGDTLQTIIASYFQRSLLLFAKQQDDAKDKRYNPLAFMADIAEQNVSLWRDMQDSFFRTTLKGNSERSKEDRHKS